MVGYLKSEITAVFLDSQSEAEACGWQVRKSGLRYVKPLCPGVTQHLDPVFTYVSQGRFCVLQQQAPLESATVKKAASLVFGKPGLGPAQTQLQMRGHGVMDRRSQGWKDRYDTAEINIMELVIPEFPRAQGYYQIEDLPDLLRELRRTVEAIAEEDYDLGSESAFLQSLPVGYTLVNIHEKYYGRPYGGAAAFAITRLLCGERDVFDRIRASGLGSGPIDHRGRP